MKALADFVLIQRDKQGERQLGSIILPANYWNEYESGTVVSVGPKCETCKPGDKVHYSRALGRTIEMNDKHYDRQLEKEIMYIVEESDQPPVVA